MVAASPRRGPETTSVGGSRPSVLLGLIALGLAVAAIVVLERDENLVGGDWVRLTLVAVFVIAGVALTRQSLTHVTGMMILAAALTAGLVFFASAHRRGDDDLEIARAAESVGVAVLIALAYVVLVILPDGRLPTRVSSVAVWTGMAVAVAIGLIRWSLQPNAPRWPLVALALGLGAVGFAIANRRYASTRGRPRQCLQWVGLAVALCIEIVIIVVSLNILIGWPPHPTETSFASLVLVAGALIAAATPSFVGRIDRLLSHAVSVAGLTGLVTLIYLIVVVGLGRVPTDEDKTVLVLSMAAAAVTALLYPSARTKLAEVSSRLVYGGHHDPADALEHFGARLTRAVPMDELLLQLAEQCRDQLDLRSVEVWTGVEGRLDRVTSIPERPSARLGLGPEELAVMTRARVSGRSWAEVWAPFLLDGLGTGPVRVIPLVHTGEVFGLLVLERPEIAEDFTDEEDRTLTELARQIALALHNSELDTALQATLEDVQRANVELRGSRARLVAAADLERRRIERDLHDGAQQNLVALAVKLRLIQRLAEEDSNGALAMVEDARGDALATIEELRALAHGIYPPLLMDRGLGVALSAAAERAVMSTTIEVDAVGRYPEEIEAAIYFCCLEALQNAGKHAGDGASVVIALAHVGEDLQFSVSDDGRGFDLDAEGSGHGFVNMKDRVGAIGGSVEVWSEPGRGTRISGSIPTGVDRAEDPNGVS